MNYFSSDETKKITLENGIELEVRTDVSKKTFNKLLKAIPSDFDGDKGFTPGQATEFSSALFDALVVGWNLDREPSVESYLTLRKDAADEIDAVLSEQFSSITPNEKETRKSERNR